MIELEVTLEDVGDPVGFTVMVTRRRLAGLDEELELIIILLARLEFACVSGTAGAAALARAKRAIEEARTALGTTGADMERALRPRRMLSLGRYRTGPSELAPEPAASTLKAAEERMAQVHAGLDLLLVLLLVFGRIRKNVSRHHLARAKRSVRNARGHVVEARAELGRAFHGEADRVGDVAFATEAS